MIVPQRRATRQGRQSGVIRLPDRPHAIGHSEGP